MVESRRYDTRSFGRALAARTPPSAHADAQQVRAAIIEELALGVIAVDAGRRVAYANRAAVAAMRGSGLRIGADAKLELRDAADAIALEGALDRAFGDALSRRRTLIIVGGSGQSLSIAVQPMAAGATSQRPLALLVLGKPMLCDASTLSEYARAKQLTPAENAVVEALREGLRAKEVAGRTRSSVATVRSHLRSIYCKTGARNLQALLATIASLPPLG